MTPKHKHFEFARKTVHLLSLFVPVCSFYSLLAAQIILIFFILFYSYSEWRKIKGKPFFAHRFIFKMQREEEQKHFAKAPLFLALGVLVALSFFSWEASLIGIVQVGFADTMAAFAGKKWGITRIPVFKRKTLVGSLVFFIAALPPSLFFLANSRAMVISMSGAFLESLPFKDWDNLTIPIVITFLAEKFMF